MPVSKNQKITLKITALTNEGNGVGHHDGQAIFVPATAPGDEAEVIIGRAKGRYAYGILQNVITASPARIESPCPVFKQCGGCQFQHITYEEELKAKQTFVADAMQRIGGFALPVREIMPSPKTQHYRNKAIYPVGVIDGKITPCFFAQRSHRFVNAQACLLTPPLFGEIASALCEMFEKQGLSVYDEETHTGALRHIFLRQGEVSGQVMVCIVINAVSLPCAEEIALELKTRFNEVTSFSLCHNQKRTNVALTGSFTNIFGLSYIEDELCGVPVQISAPSFYQVNHAGAQQLYAAALELADLKGGETLLDLYCGAGTIGLSMAHKAGSLIGVEIVESAVEMARANAQRMGFTQEKASFICADAGEAATTLAKDGHTPDVIVLDPPRKGCDEQTLAAILQMAPQKIMMVSCNPATAARDAKTLAEGGYELKAIQPADMFPRTKHVECVALLTRKDV